MKIIPWKIIPFDQRDPGQRGFVFSFYCRGSGYPASELDRHLEAGARVVLGIGRDVDPHNVQKDDPVYGFAAATADGRVIWAYVKMPVEQPDGTRVRFRGEGRGTALLAELGFRRDAPLPVLYDSITARKWAARGWKIVFPDPEPKESHG